MTTWWSVVARGTEIGVNGPATRVPSVADHFGIRSDEKKSTRSCGKRSVRSPGTFQMGDGLEVH